MGKKIKRIIFTVIVLCAVLSGCKTAPVSEIEYSKRWEKIYAGMSVEEFKEVWPKTKWVGETPDGRSMYMDISPFTVLPSIGFDYFLFENNKFIRSGLFLYTTTLFKQKDDYDLQLFVRNSAGQPETKTGGEKGK
jgi:hypothetical protein